LRLSNVKDESFERKSTVAPVFGGYMGMVLVDLAITEVVGVQNSIVDALKTSYVTAKYKSNQLPNRRGLRGLPRLAFTLDMRSTYYRYAGVKHLQLKARYDLLKRNYCYCLNYKHITKSSCHNDGVFGG
jgi:hypothetical protein